MKADRDDAPDYLRDRKSNRWRFLAILASGSAIAWAAMQMGTLDIVLDQLTGTTISSNQLVNQDAARQQHLEEMKARALAKPLAEQKDTAPDHQSAPDIHTYQPAPAPAEPQRRQTVFNDQNYTPRTDINTMAAVRTAEYTTRAQHREKPEEIRQGPARWEWENYYGSQRKRIWGEFYWLETNGKIDWGSVCMNEQAGSLRHRDCRQGAKVAFAEMCGRYEPACQAENNYNPAM